MGLNCNSCGKQATAVRFSAPVVHVEGVFNLDKSGNIQFGPCKIIELNKFESGDERNREDFVCICEHCGNSAPFSELFTVIATCMLSGEVAQEKAEIFFGDRIHLSDEIIRILDDGARKRLRENIEDLIIQPRYFEM